ncbi:MAG: hypothetical protein INQ03_15730 [Candidatus Heimdallarchaeota archaeon]|nr:hypothetical protein [Candidatus Heimdallarchaeota archaeon]
MSGIINRIFSSKLSRKDYYVIVNDMKYYVTDLGQLLDDIKALNNREIIGSERFQDIENYMVDISDKTLKKSSSKQMVSKSYKRQSDESINELRLISSDHFFVVDWIGKQGNKLGIYEDYEDAAFEFFESNFPKYLDHYQSTRNIAAIMKLHGLINDLQQLIIKNSEEYSFIEVIEVSLTKDEIVRVITHTTPLDMFLSLLDQKNSDEYTVKLNKLDQVIEKILAMYMQNQLLENINQIIEVLNLLILKIYKFFHYYQIRSNDIAEFKKIRQIIDDNLLEIDKNINKFIDRKFNIGSRVLEDWRNILYNDKFQLFDLLVLQQEQAFSNKLKTLKGDFESGGSNELKNIVETWVKYNDEFKMIQQSHARLFKVLQQRSTSQQIKIPSRIYEGIIDQRDKIRQDIINAVKERTDSGGSYKSKVKIIQASLENLKAEIDKKNEDAVYISFIAQHEPQTHKDEDGKIRKENIVDISPYIYAGLDQAKLNSVSELLLNSGYNVRLTDANGTQNSNGRYLTYSIESSQVTIDPQDTELEVGFLAEYLFLQSYRNQKIWDKDLDLPTSEFINYSEEETKVGVSFEINVVKGNDQDAVVNTSKFLNVISSLSFYKRPDNSIELDPKTDFFKQLNEKIKSSTETSFNFYLNCTIFEFGELFSKFDSFKQQLLIITPYWMNNKYNIGQLKLKETFELLKNILSESTIADLKFKILEDALLALVPMKINEIYNYGFNKLVDQEFMEVEEDE